MDARANKNKMNAMICLLLYYLLHIHIWNFATITYYILNKLVDNQSESAHLKEQLAGKQQLLRKCIC